MVVANDSKNTSLQRMGPNIFKKIKLKWNVVTSLKQDTKIQFAIEKKGQLFKWKFNSKKFLGVDDSPSLLEIKQDSGDFKSYLLMQ